jgi:hypothetical protein
MTAWSGVVGASGLETTPHDGMHWLAHPLDV